MNKAKFILLTLVVILGLTSTYLWYAYQEAEAKASKNEQWALEESNRSERLAEMAQRASAEATIAAAEAERQHRLAEKARQDCNNK